MSDATSNTVKAGFTTASIITIIFVIAKLLGHFAFSWWVVFAPLLISAAFGLVLLFIVLVIGVVAFLKFKG